MQATVVLVSGCMDSQTSLDGDRNGLFTATMLQVWADGAFRGTMRDLRNAVSARMPMTQTPNDYVVGKHARGCCAVRRCGCEPHVSKGQAHR